MLVSVSARAIGMDSATTSQTSSLRKTALNALHRRLGAKMVHFGGWDMPVEYPSSGGLIAEHKAVRGSVGVFDVSHMGDIRIRSGTKPGGALAAVQHITMNDASRLATGQAQYSAMLYPEGTFVDDVIVHRLGEDDYLLVINAGTREKDINWVRENPRGIDCLVEVHDEMELGRALEAGADFIGINNYFRFMASAATHCGILPDATRSAAHLARTSFMIGSPQPVVETAALRLSA